MTTATKAPYGTYLIDAAGRALYVLEGTRNAIGPSGAATIAARSGRR